MPFLNLNSCQTRPFTRASSGGVKDYEERERITVVKLGEKNEMPEPRTLPVAEAANLLVDIAMGHREW